MDLATYTANPDDVAGLFGVRERRIDKRAKPASASVPLPKHGPGERFVRGPVPLAWLKPAAECGERAEAVAWLLWYAAGYQRRNPIKLTPAILRELNVHPKTAKRVLLRMAERGLVLNVFARGRSPVVTIVSPKPADVAD